jgi:alpha-tubulin suppressor-like RCC1 family protein
MRRLLLATVLGLIGCSNGNSNCTSTLHLELDFTGSAVNATELVITIAFVDSTRYTKRKSQGSSRETLDVTLDRLYVGFPLNVWVGAYADVAHTMQLGEGSATVMSDRSCSVQAVNVIGKGPAPGSDMGGTSDMANMPCPGGCGSGACGGTCVNNSCGYPTDCTSCSHGLKTPGTCTSGACTTGAPTQCLGGICGNRDCATAENSVSSVAAGKGFTCAVVVSGQSFNSNASVRCWGQNVSGVIGAPASVTTQYVPQLVAGSGGLTTIVAGDDFVCGVGLEASSLKCWGSNQYGQLGLGSADTMAHPMPMPVNGLPSGNVILAAGGQHACAAVNGTIYCWGRNVSSELGTLATTTATPTMVTVAGVSINSIAVGQRHMCFNAQGSSGAYQVSCFGASDKGQVGLTDGTDHAHAVTVSGLGQEVKLSAGGDTTCAGVLANVSGFGGGQLRCWGSNSRGQLGGGPSVGAFSAMPVVVCNGCNTLTDFAVGYDHTCAALANGVECWGNNSDEELGIVGADTNAPSAIAFSVSSGAWVAAGYDHSCSAYADVTSGAELIECWGGNGTGQLGLPLSTLMSSPGWPRWGD